MENLTSILIIFFFLQILFLLGNYVNNFFKFKLNYANSILFGFSILTIFLYFLYFFIKIDNQFIFTIFLILLIFLTIKDYKILLINYYKNKKNIINYIISFHNLFISSVIIW